MERNENGMPVAPNGGARSNLGTLENFFGENSRGGCRGTQNDGEQADACLDSLPLAYAFVPWQRWRLLYSPEDALGAGTLFEELNKPLGVYGNE